MVAGLVAGWYFGWRDEPRGRIVAHDVCANMPDRGGVARTLNRVLPHSRTYGFSQSGYEVDEISRYVDRCVVRDGGGRSLLVAETTRLGSLSPERVEPRVVLNLGHSDQDAHPDLGIAATVNSETAIILVPCTPEKKDKTGASSLHVSVTLNQHLRVSVEETRKTLLSLVTKLARKQYADAKCVLPSRLPVG
ncbi:hypothetical protein GA0115251_107916 [Streptomyces sp. TverLS-915]|nr:hypothetical protein GA0115251_107916 [Streptomyces sp. TverLS-915]